MNRKTMYDEIHRRPRQHQLLCIINIQVHKVKV
jgi:hypothetical protein